ncbi:DUF6783 domain-containing protein [Fusicatenibacter sp.]
MCVTVCGRFCLNEGGVAGYGDREKAKYTAKWGVQIAGMIFQTRSKKYAPCPPHLSRKTCLAKNRTAAKSDRHINHFFLIQRPLFLYFPYSVFSLLSRLLLVFFLYRSVIFVFVLV